MGKLISPLRLDVIVRASLFEHWFRDWDRLADRPDLAVELAREHPYRIWFDSVALSKIAGSATAASDADQAFQWRARQSHTLFGNYIERGFDERYPVTVRSHRGGRSASGKMMAPRVYPIDGCHRLALLWLDGVRTLDPAHYRVVDAVAVPRDNTAVLLRDMVMPAADYARFVGWGYGIEAASSIDEIATSDRLDDDERAELASVVAMDGQTKQTEGELR